MIFIEGGILIKATRPLSANIAGWRSSTSKIQNLEIVARIGNVEPS